MRFWAAILFTSLLSAQMPRASKEPAPAPDLILHVDVNLVQVDAVVYDRKGHPVADLKPEDFEILEDGKPQAITNFSYIDLNIAGGTPVKAAKAVKKAPANPAPPSRLAREDVRRTIVLVADDLNLSFESTAYLRRALKKFIDTQMGANDMVAIARTSTGLSPFEAFTNDKRRLYAAMDAVRWNLNGRAGVGAFAPVTPPITKPGRPEGKEAADSERIAEMAQKQDEAEEPSLYVRGTMNSLMAIIQNLRRMPGRKAVILFSDGVPIAPMGADLQSLLQLLRAVADLANRSSVILNCVDARGLQTVQLSAQDNLGRRAMRNGASELTRDRSVEFNGSQDGMMFLAAQTGGRAALNGNDMTWAIDRVLDDLNGYYLIGYKPEIGTFHKADEPPVFHHIRVRTKRRGLSVRSRTGFFGVTDQESLPQPQTDVEKLIAALKSPFGVNEIPLKLTSQFVGDGMGKSGISNMLHIDAHSLAFDRQADGKYHAELELLMTGRDQNGNTLGSAHKTLQIALPEEQYESALKNGFVYTEQTPVERGGAAQVRVAVRDVASGRLGSTGDFVLLPDLRKKRMVVGSVVMGRTESKTGFENPAVRVFKAGQPVPYRFSIFNPKTKENAVADVLIQVKVFHEGKEVWASQLMTSESKLGPGSRKLMATSTLRLADTFEPGEYYLQVLATDLLAGKRAKAATQWIDFELER